MVENAVEVVVRHCLAALPPLGIHARRAVLIGSYARGDSREHSDIDLVVIAPEFDGPREITLVKRLWRATASADNRIEPIPFAGNASGRRTKAASSSRSPAAKGSSSRRDATVSFERSQTTLVARQWGGFQRRDTKDITHGAQDP